MKPLAALCDAIGVKRIILVGHSDGGTIALLYASQYPDRIAKINHGGACDQRAETIARIELVIKAFELEKLDRLKKYHNDKTTILFYAWANTWKDGTFTNW